MGTDASGMQQYYGSVKQGRIYRKDVSVRQG